MIINSIISGNGGLTASIFVTGLSATDTVTATNPSGNSISAVWNGTAWVFSGIKEYGTYTITATDGTNTATQDVLVDVFASYEIELSYVKVYGVSWDKSSDTKFSRTDDAAFFTEPTAAIGTGTGSSPFDDCYPWSGIEKVTMNGDALVKIPKFWVKVTNGASLKIQIADKEKEGFNVSPAHADRGDGKGERDYIYVSRYTLNSSYKSTSGNKSVNNMTRATARSQIKAHGTGYYQYDYLTYLTILYLYLVEYADWNAQNVIGYGYCASGNNAQINTGGTDSMTYHTGTSGSSRGANAAIQYRYIENLWGNIWQWVDGIYFSGTNIYVIKNPENFSDSANGTKLSFARASASGYVSNVGSDNTNPEYIYPTAVNGSKTTYCSDYNWYASSGVVLCAGGYWYNAGLCGVLCLNVYNVASYYDTSLSARLIYLP